MEAGRLVVEHHVVGAGHSHEVVAPGGRQEQQQVIGRVLVGRRVIGVADVDAHGQAQQLAHEMIFQPGTDDLALVEEVLRPDEADHAVDQERVERPGHAVGSGLERELVDAVVSAGREGTPLPCLEVHRLVADPGDVAVAVVLEHALLSLAQQRQVDPEARVGRLGAGDRLKQQVDRCAAFEASELGRDVRQAAGLRGDRQCFDQAVEGAEDGRGDLDRLGGRVDADHRVAAAVEQSVGRREQDAPDVVAGMVGLDANAEHPALAHRVAATGHDPHLARGQHQVFVAHQLGDRRRQLRDQARADRRQHALGRGVVEDPFAKLADRQTDATVRRPRDRATRGSAG